MRKSRNLFIWSLMICSIFSMIGCAGMAWEKALKSDSITAYEDFLHKYPESKFKTKATLKLEALYFDRAKESGTIAAYEYFLYRFPKSDFKVKAIYELGDLYFEKATATGDANVYEDFVKRLSPSNFKIEAMRKLEALYFDIVKDLGTIAAYEDFLRIYPESKFKTKLEALYFDIVKNLGTITAYEDFLQKFPESKFKDEATHNTRVLIEEIRNIEKAAKRVLPEGTKVEVTKVSRYPKEPEFVISAHLLEGHSADEESPYVRGNYGTHEKLTRLVQLRCANIIKSVATDAIPSNESVLVVRARHGVRQSQPYVPFGLGGTDVAKTLYEVRVPVKELYNNSVKSMDIDLIKSLWYVRINIIPTLEFRFGF